MSTDPDVDARFERALEALVEKAREDRHVLAVILMGSLSYDVVWEKSDIDLMLVTRDEKLERASVVLVEEDVNVHASLMTRGDFRKLVERSVGSSIMHSTLHRGRLLFSRDETIGKLWANLQGLGSRDRRARLMSAGVHAIFALWKAEKFCRVKDDPRYAYLWLTRAYGPLAEIEANLAGEIADREVLDQALRLNPKFFGRIYAELIDQKKTLRRLDGVLREIDAWLTDRVPELFQPLLDYLAEQGEVRSATEISSWCELHMGVSGAVGACEWLADKGLITKVSTPVRVTRKSQAEFEEMAFYHERH